MKPKEFMFWTVYYLISTVSIISLVIAIHQLVIWYSLSEVIFGIVSYLLLFLTPLISLVGYSDGVNKNFYGITWLIENYPVINGSPELFHGTIVFMPFLALIAVPFLRLDFWVVLSVIIINWCWYIFYSGWFLPAFLNYLVNEFKGVIDRGDSKIIFVFFWFYLIILIALLSMPFNVLVYFVVFLAPYVIFFNFMLNRFIEEELPEAKKPIGLFSYFLMVVGLVFIFLPIKQVLLERSIAILTFMLGSLLRVSSLK